MFLTVCRVAIHVPVEEEGIDGKPPVLRRRHIRVVVPLSPVVDWSLGRLVCVQVVGYLSWIIVVRKGRYQPGCQTDTYGTPHH
jgi:hypothetical protein